MLVVGGILVIAFVLIEWKVAKLPIMPSKSVYFHQHSSQYAP
jgi:hypothetical protein